MSTQQLLWGEFLDLYKEHACLWDIHSATYTRRDLRNAAYDVLLEKYREIDPAATMDMVKKKIDVFRTSYRRELRKVIESRDSSSGTYIPSLWYFNKLSFLDFDGVSDASEMKINSVISNESDDQAEVEYIDIPDDYNIPDPVIEYRLKKRKLEFKPRPRPKPQASSVTSTPVPPCSYEIDEDDCASYCTSLRMQMRELETQQKYIAQKLISDVIFLARTSQLTLDSCINTQPF